MQEKSTSDSQNGPTTINDHDRAGQKNDIRATLTRWRTASLQKQERSNNVKPEAVGRWLDEQSQAAATDLADRGIDLPWGHGVAFGEREFKVIGLRSGGIGLVYFVESSMKGGKRVYAAKTLNLFFKPDYLDLAPRVQEEIAQAFLEETLPWLEMGRHPHIISVHMLENVLHPILNRNIPFIYSEYVPGGNLRQYLKEKGTLKYKEVLTLGIQLCDSLLHAYKHGLEAHWDIKPDNIMIVGESIFKLSDFSTNVIGTPGYMAPEQVFGLWKMWDGEIEPGNNPVDHRADQFAVGLVMLESYFGSHPFPICWEACLERDSAKSFSRDGVGEIADNSLPKVFRKLLARVLSTEPENRFQDMSVMKKALLAAHEEGFGAYKKPVVEENDSAEWWFLRGKAFMTLSRWVQAEAPIKEALKRCQGIPGTDLFKAQCMMNLGMVHRETCRFHDAEKKYQEALKLLRRLPRQEREVARCSIKLSGLYRRTGRFPEAENAVQDALKIYQKIQGNVLEMASCLKYLGNIFFTTSRYLEAEKVYKEALEIYRGAPGSEYELAGCLANLGSVWDGTRRFSEAEKAHKEALKIYRRIPGTEYMQAVVTGNMAYGYLFAGRFSEAEMGYREALDIYRRIPGTELDQAKCLGGGLGHVYRDSGRLEKAEQAFEQALKILIRIPGTEHRQAQCKANMGILYFQQDRLEKAERILTEVKEILQGIAGMEHSLIGCTLELARCRLAQKDYASARSLAEETLKLCKPLPPESTDEIRASCKKILEDLEDSSLPPTKEK